VGNINLNYHGNGFFSLRCRVPKVLYLDFCLLVISVFYRCAVKMHIISPSSLPYFILIGMSLLGLYILYAIQRVIAFRFGSRYQAPFLAYQNLLKINCEGIILALKCLKCGELIAENIRQIKCKCGNRHIDNFQKVPCARLDNQGDSENIDWLINAILGIDPTRTKKQIKTELRREIEHVFV